MRNQMQRTCCQVQTGVRNLLQRSRVGRQRGTVKRPRTTVKLGALTLVATCQNKNHTIQGQSAQRQGVGRYNWATLRSLSTGKELCHFIHTVHKALPGSHVQHSQTRVQNQLLHHNLLVSACSPTASHITAMECAYYSISTYTNRACRKHWHWHFLLPLWTMSQSMHVLPH